MPSIAQNMDSRCKEYWEKGYTVIPGVFDAQQIERFRNECNHLWLIPGLGDDLNLRTEFRRGSQNEYVLDRLDPVLDLSPVLSSAANDPHLLDVIDTLLGARSALLKCKLIRKDPGTKGYAVHQDFLYWTWLNVAPERLCSVALSLYDTDERSGGIGFYPGHHQTLISGPSDNLGGDCDPAHIDKSVSEVPLLKSGDVLVFHSLAPHFSGPNASDLPRTILLPSYCATNETGLYCRYYEREIKRRCSDVVGFERYFDRLAAMSQPAR